MLQMETRNKNVVFVLNVDFFLINLIKNFKFLKKISNIKSAVLKKYKQL